MLKKVIILVMLSSILFALILVKGNTKSNESSEYITIEYKISNIDGNHYYGKNNEGKKIQFSVESIVSNEEIQVGDEVLCYFEKDNIANGIIKVEKK